MELIEARRKVVEALKDGPSDGVSLVFETLFHLSEKDFILNPHRLLNKEEIEILDGILAEIRTKRPLAYILNTAYFMGEAFYVDERVLIPRYDTEQSIDVIENLSLNAPEILEIGTGSGCVAITLAKHFEESRIVACDLSEDALAVAQINKKKHGVKHINFIKSDLFSEIEGSFDIIYSNPPYISRTELKELDESVVSYEPLLALDGGEDGLDFYRAILRDAEHYLKPKGYLVFEIGAEQGDSVYELMKTSGYKDVNIKKDFSGLDRVVYGRLTNV